MKRLVDGWMILYVRKLSVGTCSTLWSFEQVATWTRSLDDELVLQIEPSQHVYTPFGACLNMEDPVTIDFNPKSWSSMTWMTWGYPHIT